MSTRSFRFVRALSVSAAALTISAASVFACSSSGDRPGSGGSSGVVGEGGFGADVTIEEAGEDARAKSDAASCAAPPENTAPTVNDEFIPGTRPVAVGGVIKPGVYHLVKSEIYTGTGGRSGNVGTIIRRTVLFTDKLFTFSESEGTIDGGIDESDTQGKSYDADGNLLLLSLECASAGGTFPKGNIEFSVVGEEIHLFTSFSQREVLRPVNDAGN